MIEIKGLTVRLDGTAALDGVDARVGVGEYIWLAGPNGAGKSTLLRVLAGLVRPAEGQVLLAGHPPGSGEGDRRVGYVPDVPLLYDVLTPREHVEFLERAWSVPGADGRERRLGAGRAETVLGRFALDGVAHVYARALSLGQRRRLSLALAMVHEPDLLLLDEPYNGLDTETADLLTELVAEHVGRGGTTIVATHVSVHLAARRLIALRDGRVVADQPLPADADRDMAYSAAISGGDAP